MQEQIDKTYMHKYHKYYHSNVNEKIDKINLIYIPAHEWRVVCDSMLGGLYKQLRMCGIDTVFVSNDRGSHQSANVALNENRVLLTKANTSQKVSTLFIHF